MIRGFAMSTDRLFLSTAPGFALLGLLLGE